MPAHSLLAAVILTSATALITPSCHTAGLRTRAGRTSMGADRNAPVTGAPSEEAFEELRAVLHAEQAEQARLQSQPANASAAAGLAGLAATGAGLSTIAATAGGVCVGGACAVGASAGAGGAAAASFGGWLAGGVVAAASFFGMTESPLLSDVPPPRVEFITGGVSYIVNEKLAAAIRQSTPPDDIRGKPVVVEFYRPACSRCNRLAPLVLASEERAMREGVAWTMINVDDPSSEGLVGALGVKQLPHFSFIAASGKLLATASGAVSPADVEEFVEVLTSLVPNDMRTLGKEDAATRILRQNAEIMERAAAWEANRH